MESSYYMVCNLHTRETQVTDIVVLKYSTALQNLFLAAGPD